MIQGWSLDPIFNSLTGVVVIWFVLLMAMILIRPYRNLQAIRRRILLVLRIALVLILGIVMLRPGRTVSETLTRKAAVMVLTDETESMQQPSAVDTLTRWQHQTRVWQNTAEFLQDRSDLVLPKWFGYTDHISKQRWDDSQQWTMPDEPVGETTDLGASLYEAVTSEPGQQIHAVVLMGDGRQTAYRSDVDIRQAIDELRRRGIPLIGIPFGREGDVQQSKDIAIEQLPQQFRVFSGNDIEINAIARLRGVLSEPVQVQLKMTPTNGETQIVQTVDVTATETDDIQPVQFTLTAGEPGTYMLEVVANSVDGEVLLANNRQTAYLTVLEGGLRVLYLYGNRLGEQLEMRRSLASSPDIELSESYLRHLSSKNWPDPRANVIADQQFDVLILEDVHADALGEENLQAVAQAIEDGKGLMMLGGFYSFGPGAYKDSPLDAVLPIEMEIFERQEVGAAFPVRMAFHIDREVAMRSTVDHPLTKLGSTAEIWQQLPPLEGANLFQGVKETGEIILTSDRDEPLMVASQYGLGRVVAFAGDTTWRWARHGHAETLRRFWRQNILWLARRENLQQRDVWLQLDQRRFVPGGEIEFKVGVDILGGEELDPSNLVWQVILKDPTENTQPITASRQSGIWGGVLPALDQPGEYQLQAEVTDGATQVGQAVVNFQILDMQPERNNSLADFQQFNRLAEMTAEHGGRVVEPKELNTVLQEIIDEASDEEVEIQMSWQLGATQTSAWVLMLIFSSLFTLDWSLRKRWGLV